MPARNRAPPPPELAAAPELAVIFVLDAALDSVVRALVAQHPTLMNDLRRHGEDGPVVDLADGIRRRAMSLRQALRRYRRAAQDAMAHVAGEDADLPL